VTGRPRKAAPRSPPAIAIHNDRDVARQSHVTTRGAVTSKEAIRRPLDLHDLLFFRDQELLDIGDVFVRELLHFGFRSPLVVLRNQLFLQGFFDVVHDIAADVADGHARIFRIMLSHLRDLAAALFGERRHGNANDGAGRDRIEPEA
jgi:hypothetical protein